MSCPYFYPLEPRTGEAESHAALLPLGNWWTGLCRAAPGESCAAEENATLPLCHLGYARGQCTRFPSGEGADAVRFTLRRDDGQSLHLYYVIERDHHPLSHGSLEYSLASARFSQPLSDPTACRQAEAYVASYLQRKSAA